MTGDWRFEEKIISEKNYYPLIKVLRLIKKVSVTKKGKNEIYILRLIDETKEIEIEIPPEWAEMIFLYEKEESKKYFGVSKYPKFEINDEEFIKDKIKLLNHLLPYKMITKFGFMLFFCEHFPNKCYEREYPRFYAYRKYLGGKTPKYSNYGAKMINELFDDHWISHEVASGKHEYRVNPDKRNEISQLKD